MAIMIVGGAGYIGSHAVKYLIEQGEDIVVVDNMQSGHREAVDEKADFWKVDIRDREALDEVFKSRDIESVIHFGANSLVGESMENPSLYFNNNVYGMICLLDVMKDNGVDKIVFSSTAAAYGEPEQVPILEGDRTEPTNTYGETKVIMEKMMKWYDRAYGIRFVALRYFNACGAWDGGLIGEDHSPETHLIPVVLQVPLGKRDKIMIFGSDYPTEDGTCIRDYIHVRDLASAHYLALQYLRSGKPSDVFNLGSGTGYSVKEIIEVARKVVGHPIPAEVAGRRAGDPAVLIASSEKAKTILGWQPEYDDITRIVTDAWQWHSSHPDGFSD